MKADIHPKYQLAKITCACGNEMTTRTTTGDQAIDICSKCHPFFTGTQKLIDTGGRIERFRRRYNLK